MGISVRLEDERCKKIEQVADPFGVVKRLIRRIEDDQSYVWLRAIDPYQDTVFNQRQSAGSDEEKETLDLIAALARRCASQPHTYVRFMGD